MIFREADINDIKQIMIIRFAVKENILSSPALVTDKDCEEYITVPGKGWVCEIDNAVVGFAIADLQDKSIWALFVHPDYEKKGIGRKLHDDMLDWYFSKTKETVWLTTAPRTRTEMFYRKSGWKETGRKPNGEIKFELTINDWENKN
jgi:GNAT superfamily N-acetyltransferase